MQQARGYQKNEKRKASELDFHKVLPSFPGGSVGKDTACNAGDTGLIPGLGRSLAEGNGNQLQYSSLGNPMNRVA